MTKVDVADSGCWRWNASLTRKGYGQFTLGGKLRKAHRVAYEHFVGPIPDGLVLDHLCRNRACVNPRHFEPVTTRENVLRGEGLAAKLAARATCPKGHPFDAANTYTDPNGARRCRTCRKGQANDPAEWKAWAQGRGTCGCGKTYSRRNKARHEQCRQHREWEASRPAEPDPAPTNPAVARFWSRVRLTADGCWQWDNVNANGYGNLGVNGYSVMAHRFAYELIVGPIPEGHVVDHLCRNRGCVNTDHLQPVLPRVNTLRGTAPSAEHAKKTHCPRGHEYDRANTMILTNGGRACRACRRVPREGSASIAA